MFGEPKVNLQLTPRAKHWIEAFKSRSTVSSPILGILLSSSTKQGMPRLTLGLYDRSQLREGWLCNAPDLEFVVIQESLLGQLDGKTLDIDDDGPAIL